jgi:hypothetical protein
MEALLDRHEDVVFNAAVEVDIVRLDALGEEGDADLLVGFPQGESS